MNPKTFNRLIALLETHLDEIPRRTLVTRAFRTAPFYPNIDWDDSARAFTVRLLVQLENYGELQIDDDTVRPAIAHLLIELYPDVGGNVQAEINELLVEMGEPALPVVSSNERENTVDLNQSFPPTAQSNRDGILWIIELLMSLVISVWATYLVGFLDTNSIGSLIFILFSLALLSILLIHKLHGGQRLWQFLHQHSRWLWAGLIGSLLLIAVPFWLMRPATPEGPHTTQCKIDQHCVLLATFTPEENETAKNITIDTQARLQSIVGEDFSVQAIGPIRSEAEAQEAAQTYNALLVVWGYVLTDTEDERVFNFTLSNRLGLDSANSVRPMRLLPLNYEQGDELACQASCLSLQGEGEIDGRLTAIAHATKGLLHYTLEEFAKAQHEFSQAMEIDSIDQPIAESKATESKVAESELLLCDPAIIEQFKLPEDAASEAWRPDLLRYYLGRTLAFQGHYAAALEQLHIVAAHNASDPAVWVAIALACRGWLGPESTIDLTYFWQEALTRAENQPDSAPHLFNRAIIYELQGEWFEAREDYYKVVGMFNAGERVTYAARVGSARAGAKLGETSNASQLLKGAITVDSEAIWAYLEMARLYSEEPSNADRWLADAGKRAASHHYPGNRNLQLARADICRSRQDFACAAEAYKQALAHSPPSSWLHTRVGDFYRHEPRWELALIQYEAAAQLRESDPQVYANLGYARVANNDLQGAAEAYQQAIERSYPADDVTIEAYCGALAQIIEAGQLDESLAALERCRMES